MHECVCDCDEQKENCQNKPADATALHYFETKRMRLQKENC